MAVLAREARACQKEDVTTARPVAIQTSDGNYQSKQIRNEITKLTINTEQYGLGKLQIFIVTQVHVRYLENESKHAIHGHSGMILVILGSVFYLRTW